MGEARARVRIRHPDDRLRGPFLGQIWYHLGAPIISSSNPPLGGGHGRNFANDPVENEGANRFSVSAEVDRSWSATQRLRSMGSQRGGPTEN